MIRWYDPTPNSPLSVPENDIKAKESGFEYCEFFSCILMSAVLFVFIWTRKKTDPGWIENWWNMNFNILPQSLQRQKYFKSKKVKTQPFYLSANCHLLGPVTFQILCIIIKFKISLMLKCSFLNCAHLHQSWDIFICPFWEKNQVSEVRRDWCDVKIFYLLFWKNNQVSEVRREWCDVIK